MLGGGASRALLSPFWLPSGVRTRPAVDFTPEQLMKLGGRTGRRRSTRCFYEVGKTRKC